MWNMGPKPSGPCSAAVTGRIAVGMSLGQALLEWFDQPATVVEGLPWTITNQAYGGQPLWSRTDRCCHLKKRGRSSPSRGTAYRSEIPDPVLYMWVQRWRDISHEDATLP